MLKYLLGLFMNLFNPAVSILAIIDNKSIVNRQAKVNRFVKVFKSTLDKYSYIGNSTSLMCVDVGKYCSIADKCAIGLANHTLFNLSTSPLFTSKVNGTGSSWVNIQNSTDYKKTTIGNDVWIGTRVIILGGVSVGDGAVIGAGSIVTKDVPPYAIVAGVPARIIRFRFSQDVIDKLLEVKWWNLSEDILKQNIFVFQTDQISVKLIYPFQQV